jgi:hypothetical protein
VTLRARWVTLRSSLGDAKSSLGDAESSLGDAKSSLGDTTSLLGDVQVLSPVVGRWGYALWGDRLLRGSLLLHVAACGVVLVLLTRWFLEHVQKPVERIFSRRPARLSFN